MALPGPQGTVQYSTRAPTERSLHTEIMEKSPSLFFYRYQSMVHLHRSMSLAPLGSQLPLFFPFYPQSPTPPPPSPSISSSVLLPHLAVWSLVCGMQGGIGFSFSFSHAVRSGFDSVLSMSLFSLLCEEPLWSALRKWCIGHQIQSS